MERSMERDLEKDLIEIECAIKSQKEKDNVFTMSVLQRCYQLVSQLKEYKGLEEQNRLLKLPCKVGDMVWDIDFGRPCGYEVTGFSFGSLNDDDWEEEKVLDKVVVYYTNSNGSITGTFAVSEIGKNVFLTREEAEAALKELERGGKGE